MRADLTRLKRDTTSGKVSAARVFPPESRTRFSWPWAAGAIATCLAAALIWWLRSPLPPPRLLSVTQITRDGIRKNPAILTDGVRLYFGEAPDNLTLSQVSMNGGDVAAIPTPFPNAQTLDISPDHSQLLVASFVGTELADPFWIVPLPAGSPRRLGDITGHDATFSPDGRQLIYAKGKDLFLAKSDGSESRKLLTAPGVPNAIKFSPGRGANSIHGSGSATEYQFSLGSQGRRNRPSRPASWLE